MTWIIEDDEKNEFNKVIDDEFKDEVIQHARRKLILNKEISDEEFNKLASDIYDRYEKFLSSYEGVTYESFVKLMIVYFVNGINVVESNEFKKSLFNDRFHINTRISMAYDLTKKLVLKK